MSYDIVTCVFIACVCAYFCADRVCDALERWMDVHYGVEDDE